MLLGEPLTAEEKDYFEKIACLKYGVDHPSQITAKMLKENHEAQYMNPRCFRSLYNLKDKTKRERTYMPAKIGKKKIPEPPEMKRDLHLFDDEAKLWRQSQSIAFIGRLKTAENTECHTNNQQERLLEYTRDRETAKMEKYMRKNRGRHAKSKPRPCDIIPPTLLRSATRPVTLRSEKSDSVFANDFTAQGLNVTNPS